ncbi:hypothetical protein EJB05_12689 [Eragrostis curvula]|uniref:Uncharacterized protein n=1 Tax=Eragrostis curvula TaxID=38414 RepID=A0A5J9VTR5_9POAL|nr:hypothetical protein EJB05_12689 [Eragrostis curvula]
MNLPSLHLCPSHHQYCFLVQVYKNNPPSPRPAESSRHHVAQASRRSAAVPRIPKRQQSAVDSATATAEPHVRIYAALFGRRGRRGRRIHVAEVTPQHSRSPRRGGRGGRPRRPCLGTAHPEPPRREVEPPSRRPVAAAALGRDPGGSRGRRPRSPLHHGAPQIRAALLLICAAMAPRRLAAVDRR